MKEYVCKRCAFKTTFKNNMRTHLKRKKHCEALHSDVSVLELLKELDSDDIERPFNCDICDACFVTKNGLNKHKRKIHVDDSENDEDDKSAVIKTLKKQIEVLNKMLGSGGAAASSVTNNTIQTQNNIQTQQNQNIQININLNPYGQESLTHITDDIVKACVDNLDVSKLIKEIHFNPNVPENRNVLYKSNKQQILKVYENGVWVDKDTNHVLDQLLQKGYRILASHVMNHISNNDSLSQDVKDFIENWVFDLGAMNRNSLKVREKRKIYMVIRNETLYVLETQ